MNYGILDLFPLSFITLYKIIMYFIFFFFVIDLVPHDPEKATFPQVPQELCEALSLKAAFWDLSKSGVFKNSFIEV